MVQPARSERMRWSLAPRLIEFWNKRSKDRPEPIVSTEDGGWEYDALISTVLFRRCCAWLCSEFSGIAARLEAFQFEYRWRWIKR
jgi:hypothetical protein